MSASRPDEEPADEEQPIFFGGINAYLQLKYSFFRHVPKWLDKALDSRPLLGKIPRLKRKYDCRKRSRGDGPFNIPRSRWPF